jgi:ribonuclease HI
MVAQALAICNNKALADQIPPLSFPTSLLLTPLSANATTLLLKFNHAVWRAREWHAADPSRSNPPTTIKALVGLHTTKHRSFHKQPTTRRNAILTFYHRYSTIPKESIITWTDGSTLGNPGPAGAGFYRSQPSKAAGYAALHNSTNNRAEIYAVRIATVAANDRHYIITDSTHTINALSKPKPPRTNPTLVEATRQTIKTSQHNTIFLHVPAHSGIVGNEMADIIANKGSAASREGLGTPLAHRQVANYMPIPPPTIELIRNQASGAQDLPPGPTPLPSTRRRSTRLSA